jgi:disulfide bond formation protein DsbB
LALRGVGLLLAVAGAGYGFYLSAIHAMEDADGFMAFLNFGCRTPFYVPAFMLPGGLLGLAATPLLKE